MNKSFRILILSERNYAMSIIINLTQHAATPDQIEAGVIDLPQAVRQQLSELLTFNELPEAADMEARAEAIRALVDTQRQALDVDVDAVMVGGAPFFMGYLEYALLPAYQVVYAFSRRVSVEEIIDGVVRKVNTFRHEGFVPVPFTHRH